MMHMHTLVNYNNAVYGLRPLHNIDVYSDPPILKSALAPGVGPGHAAGSPPTSHDAVVHNRCCRTRTHARS